MFPSSPQVVIVPCSPPGAALPWLLFRNNKHFRMITLNFIYCNPCLLGIRMRKFRKVATGRSLQ